MNSKIQLAEHESGSKHKANARAHLKAAQDERNGDGGKSRGRGSGSGALRGNRARDGGRHRGRGRGPAADRAAAAAVTAADMAVPLGVASGSVLEPRLLDGESVADNLSAVANLIEQERQSKN